MYYVVTLLLQNRAPLLQNAILKLITYVKTDTFAYITFRSTKDKKMSGIFTQLDLFTAELRGFHIFFEHFLCTYINITPIRRGGRIVVSGLRTSKHTIQKENLDTYK